MKHVFTCAAAIWIAGAAAAQQAGSGWAAPAAPAAPAGTEAPGSGGAAGGSGTTETGAAGGWGAAPADTAGAGFEPEEQVATGRFLTALEVRPILSATRASWVAVREFDGQDLLYFTQILSWRCGLHEIRFAVNGGAEEVFPAEPCYVDTNAPNAIRAEDVLPYLTYPPGSVAQVDVRLIYDDGTEATATFERRSILMP